MEIDTNNLYETKDKDLCTCNDLFTTSVGGVEVKKESQKSKYKGKDVIVEKRYERNLGEGDNNWILESEVSYMDTEDDPILEHGIEKFYYDNGKIKQKIPWKDGNIDGKEVFYYKNGSVKKIINWNNNRKCGITKQFYPNGQLKKIIPYNTKGDLHGIVKYYYRSGRLKYTTPFVEGKERDDLLDNPLKRIVLIGE